MSGGDPEQDSGVAAYARSTRVARDVVFFFHLQAEYAGVMEDLDYTFFMEEYWTALVEDEEMTLELRRGCLALLYAMGMYEAGNVGVALGDALPACLNTLKRFEPSDDETRMLKEITMRALSAAAAVQEARDEDTILELLGMGTWVHRVAVRPYFEVRSRHFERAAQQDVEADGTWRHASLGGHRVPRSRELRSRLLAAVVRLTDRWGRRPRS